MELLAPAGSPAHLMAALDAGADAVYLGGKLFSARKFAGNFSDEELKSAVHQAHLHGACVYITLNTLIGDMEMGKLREYLLYLNTIPVDGLLVQDFGVAAMARKYAPHIPLHASTQMTVSNLDEVLFLKKLGFQRVVLSRELSLKEIGYIVHSAGIEIEVFVHGALCVCYSGQCLMSSFIGGRSGNRGACAQPCRMPYDLINKSGVPCNQRGNYILSLKDMLGIHRISEFLKAGVTSLKVEGRMKSPEYVYNTISAYRKVIDSAEAGFKTETDSFEKSLKEEFNRGYTSGYLDDHIGCDMFTGMAPGNHGIDAGRIGNIHEGSFLFRPDDQPEGILSGISYETNKNTIAFVPSNKIRPGKNHSVKVLYDGSIPRAGGRVYWVLKPEKKSFQFRDLRVKIPLTLRFTALPGTPLVLVLTDDQSNEVTVRSEFIAQKAVSRVTADEEIKNQLSRLGNTWFTVQSAEIRNEGCMVPKSLLNHMRTEGIEKLQQLREKYHESMIPAIREGGFKLSVSQKRLEEGRAHILLRTCSLNQMKYAFEAGVRHFIFGGESYDHRAVSYEQYETAAAFARGNGCHIYFASPRMVRQKNLGKVSSILSFLDSLAPDGIILEHPGFLWTAEERKIHTPVIAGTSFNIFNSEALDTVKEWGMSGAVVSQEVSLPQIRDMISRSGIPLAAVIYGYTEMMISEYCVINAVMGEKDKNHCPGYCMQDSYSLRDQEGRLFPVKTDEWCHMHILNCNRLDMRPYLKELVDAGLTSLIVDVRGVEEPVNEIIGDSVKILDGNYDTARSFNPQQKGVTRGHFFKGVL